MPNLTEKTLAELREMSAAEIRTAIAGYFSPLSKEQLIEFEMDAAEFADAPTVTTGEHGILTREQTVRDALGDVVRIEHTEYSYYPGGEVDEITTVVENASEDVIEDKCIKHYTDKQPEGHNVLTVVLGPRDTSAVTAPWHGKYWHLINIGSQASLWAVEAPAQVLLDLHEELWSLSPIQTFGVLGVASARSNVFLPAAVRHHAGMSGVEALARRDRIADYMDGLGMDTTDLRAAMDEQAQMVGIVHALGYEVSQLWHVMGR